jgi:hypothetical protein
LIAPKTLSLAALIAVHALQMANAWATPIHFAPRSSRLAMARGIAPLPQGAGKVSVAIRDVLRRSPGLAATDPMRKRGDQLMIE